MNSEHWLLAVLWVGYCLIHSFLASLSIKKRIEQLAGRWFKYYRLLYSIFAFITLVMLLWFQFTMPSWWLYSAFIIRMGGLIFCLPGVAIMIVCVYKYFYELSGIQALQKDNPVVHLQQTGLHKYVRHPLYLGTLLFIWGLFLILPALSNLIACIVITIYVITGIHLEEKKLYMEFGEAYREYAKKVPMLVPKI